MRGKVLHSTSSKTLRRITPAYAGKSLYADNKGLEEEGSPPPMRGKALFAE